MKRIRYLSLLVMLFSIINVGAQEAYNPSNPPEPGQPPVKVTLLVAPDDGGSCYGAGKYEPGQNVNISANANTGYVFDYWSLPETPNEVVTRERNFAFIMGEEPVTLVAHFIYDPSSPGEPDHPNFFRLKLNSGVGGSVSGGGSYRPNSSVWINASSETGYRFTGWYEDETLISENAYYNFITREEDVTLEARFTYDPESPIEPNEPAIKHGVTLRAGEGGYTNFGRKSFGEGEAVNIHAYCNTGYRFTGWYQDDVLYTSLPSFNYEMGTEAVSFEARFVFDPDNPEEPAMPTTKLYSFYLLNQQCRPGDLISIPLYLNALEPIKDMSFQLTFPAEYKPSLSSMTISPKATGYTVTTTEPNDEAYFFSFVGGDTPTGNTAILTLQMQIPDDFETGTSFQIKINQVSIVQPDDSHHTASTHNGRVAVYKMGDANGDNSVNEVDAQLILDVSVGNIGLSDLAVPVAVEVPGGNNSALEVNAQLVLDYSVATDKPW